MAILFALTTILFASCTYVEPNHVGVLQENYGKNGKSDFSIVKGKVSTWGAGTELYQVPLYEQRGEYVKPMALKAADNTEFSANPTYSYKVMEERAIDVVFNNRQLADSDSFLQAIEDNILEMRIRDIIKEESRRYTTDTLMGTSGSLRFEERVQEIVKIAFEKSGFELISFSCQLDFPNRVKEKIEQRNEVNQDQAVVEQQIAVAQKKMELQRINTLIAIERSKSLTNEILRERAIDGWVKAGCPMPKVLGSGNTMYGIFDTSK
jgi:hypothetical protein